MKNNTKSSSAISIPAGEHAPNLLVVDDDPMLRKLLVMTLQMQGYQVLCAEDGHQALAMAKAHERGDIDVLITDINMPGITGCELAEALHAVRPEIRTIFTSGCSSSVMAAINVDFPGAMYVSKPYAPGAMGGAIRALLSQAPLPC